jgi:hypothetical protein
MPMEPDQACFLPPITDNGAWEDDGRHPGGSDDIGFGCDVDITRG